MGETRCEMAYYGLGLVPKPVVADVATTRDPAKSPEQKKVKYSKKHNDSEEEKIKNPFGSLQTNLQADALLWWWF